MKKYSKNIISLLLADIIWGGGFVAQRLGGDAVGAYSFNALRSFLGCLVLIPVILIMRGSKRRRNYTEAAIDIGISAEPMENSTNPHSEKKTLWLGGVICGTALFLASNLQQLGITLGGSIGKAGFLTACYIILVPIFGLFLKKKCGWNVGLGVAMALVGLYLLCMTDGNLALTAPDLLLLGCAVAFAIQILAINYFAPMVDSVKLSCLEFLVCGIETMIPTYFVDMGHSVSGFSTWLTSLGSSAAIGSILYAGILSCGVAYTLQIVGEKNFNPTVASLFMSLESVASVLCGWIFLHETMTGREAAGCVVLFLAVIVAQLPVGSLIAQAKKRKGQEG